MKYTEEQIRHQNELRAARDAITSRKRRTRRLIEHGAVAESMLPGSDEMDAQEFKELLTQKLYPGGRRNPKGEDVSQ